MWAWSATTSGQPGLCSSPAGRVPDAGIAEVAGLKTTWCHDPWGTVIILMEKGTTAKPYWAQWMPRD